MYTTTSRCISFPVVSPVIFPQIKYMTVTSPPPLLIYIKQKTISPPHQKNSNHHNFLQNQITRSQKPMAKTNTQKLFLITNYILLGAASSCIFLTLSLRLIPSLAGFFLILLHILTISGAIAGCAAASSGAGKWYVAHMMVTVLTAIFEGSVSVLIFTSTRKFLGNLKSYVREDDGVVILKLAGGLCVIIFCLEWVVLTLAFFSKYNDYLEDNGDGVKGGRGMVQEELSYLPYKV